MTPRHPTDTDTSISAVGNHACLHLNSVSGGFLDITTPMLMVNLDCSDSQAATSTSWRQRFFVRDMNPAAEKFPVAGFARQQCRRRSRRRRRSAAVTQARPCRLRGRHTTLVPTSSKQGNDKGGADRCMIDNKNQLPTTTRAGAATGSTGRGHLF